MKLFLALLIAPLALGSGMTAGAICVYPQAPQNLPNGATADKPTMLAAQAAVKEYSQAVQGTYLPCLEQEKNDSIAALDPADPDFEKKKKTLESIHAKKHNAAMDELQATANTWSEEIKAFDRQGKE
jgi:hypothetical protein